MAGLDRSPFTRCHRCSACRVIGWQAVFIAELGRTTTSVLTTGYVVCVLTASVRWGLQNRSASGAALQFLGCSHGYIFEY